MQHVLLSVIIPVYNEAGTIAKILDRVIDAWPEDKEIIVVDDGSEDRTAETIQNWYSRCCGSIGVGVVKNSPRIIVLSHEANRGKGAAIRTAMERASGRYVVIQDADLEYDPQDYRALLTPLLEGKADVVYGSRRLGEQMNKELKLKEQWLRKVKQWINLYYHGVSVLNLLVRLWYGLRISDEATCYKVFPLEILRRMDLKCERFEFCPEVTAKAARMGLRLIEVPIRYSGRTRREGKKIRFRDGWEAVRTLWRYRSWRQPHLYEHAFMQGIVSR